MTLGDAVTGYVCALRPAPRGALVPMHTAEADAVLTAPAPAPAPRLRDAGGAFGLPVRRTPDVDEHGDEIRERFTGR